MKKFLVLSSLVAIVGLGVGIATRQDSAPQATSAVAADVTTTTLAAEPATTSTTARAATKAATKQTTPTTAPATTTSTTRPATTTTTVAVPATTIATVAGPAPTCTITPAKAAVAKNEVQALHLTSNLANTPVRVTTIYPASPNSMNKIPQQFVHSATTDSSGSDTWNPVNNPGNTTGLVRVSVNFYPVGAKQIGALCSTTFEAR